MCENIPNFAGTQERGIAMRTIRVIFLLGLYVILVSSCREKPVDEVTMFSEDGLIFTEMFLVGEDESRFWKIREMDGRGTLIIQEGVLGGKSSFYEIYEEDREALLQRARKLASEKFQLGYEVYGPEAYSTLVVQIDADQWNDIGDLDQLVLVEELLNDYMNRSGNGNCYSSDIDEHHIRFFVAAFDPDVAVGAILSMFSEENLSLDIIIFKEVGNEVKVLFPFGFQGDVSLI